MLLQRFHRSVPELDAWASRTTLRGASFSIAVMRSQGLVHDYGLLIPTVAFVTRLVRSQLVVLVDGHGYFAHAGGLVRSVRAGDVIASDQRMKEPEGYAGDPCLLIAVEWEAGSPFGAPHAGPARVGQLGTRDRQRFRTLLPALGEGPVAAWLEELTALFRECGIMDARFDRGMAAGPGNGVGEVFGALGSALSRLEDFPQLGEIAGVVGLSERQANRKLGLLAREYAHPYDGWRDFVNESRIEWATQLLSIPTLSLSRVAALTGFRSSVALVHAFRYRGEQTPGQIARLHRQRW